MNTAIHFNYVVKQLFNQKLNSENAASAIILSSLITIISSQNAARILSTLYRYTSQKRLRSVRVFKIYALKFATIKHINACRYKNNNNNMPNLLRHLHFHYTHPDAYLYTLYWPYFIHPFRERPMIQISGDRVLFQYL